jgi:hypothetical protein
MAAAKKTNGAPSDVMGFLNYYLVEKAPFSLPQGLVDFLVKVAPVVSLILGILGVVGALALFGLGSILGPFVVLGGGAAALGSTFLAAIFSGIIAIMYIMAYSGLKNRKMSGWNLLFYIETLYVVSDLVNVRIASAVLSAVIGYYFLFQMRAAYKK